MQTTCPRADEVLARAPLDNGNVDPRQRQLARQHQPRRAASGYHHRRFDHTPPLPRPLSRVRGEHRWCLQSPPPIVTADRDQRCAARLGIVFPGTVHTNPS